MEKRQDRLLYFLFSDGKNISEKIIKVYRMITDEKELIPVLTDLENNIRTKVYNIVIEKQSVYYRLWKIEYMNEIEKVFGYIRGKYEGIILRDETQNYIDM